MYVYCVRNWTLSPPAFTHNLAQLKNMTGVPWLLYVPFFCRQNVYMGRFRFVNGSSGSSAFAQPHPDDALAFYRMLFDYGLVSRLPCVCAKL